MCRWRRGMGKFRYCVGMRHTPTTVLVLTAFALFGCDPEPDLEKSPNPGETKETEDVGDDPATIPLAGRCEAADK